MSDPTGVPGQTGPGLGGMIPTSPAAAASIPPSEPGDFINRVSMFHRSWTASE